jgi:iodotyrosine deiodinase
MEKIVSFPVPDASVGSHEEMAKRARDFSHHLEKRRSIRHFSDQPVSEEVIRSAISAAASAPSAANQQPWRFAAISDPDLRTTIRELAEIEESEFYAGLTLSNLLKSVQPMGTTAEQPYLEEAPWLIAVFAKQYDRPDQDMDDGANVYVNESVGIAVGFMIATLHQAGVATLIHEPVAADYLNELAGCVEGERLAMIVLAGQAASNATVPAAAVRKKPFHAVATFLTSDPMAK